MRFGGIGWNSLGDLEGRRLLSTALRHRCLEMVKRLTARVVGESNVRECDVDRVCQTRGDG